MAFLRELYRGVGHGAAAKAGLRHLIRIVPDQRAQLRERLWPRRLDPRLQRRPALFGEALQAFGDKVVLGLEAAVEAGLGDAGLADNLVHANGTDPSAIEEFARRLEDAHRRLLAGF